MDLRERGKQRRAGRVLEAARGILRSEGVDGLQMRSLARDAELSVRTLYNHFGSKGEVLAALASDALDRLAEELEALAIEDPLERSRAIITVSIARFGAEREVMRPVLGEAFSGRAESRGALFLQARALQEEALEAAMAARMLRRDVPARLLGHQILSSYNQAAWMWACSGVDRADFETQALHAWACLLFGVARGPARARIAAELAALELPMKSLADEGRLRSEGRASRA